MALISKNLAPFIAASIVSGGEYDEMAQECIADLANDLALKDLEKNVVTELKNIDALEDDAFDEYLAKAAAAITDQEAVLMICLNVLAADMLISIDEITNYFTFADILGVSEERASEIFDDFVDEVDDLVIEDESTDK